jgi:peroxiredoxin
MGFFGKKMAALVAGKTAPDFELKSLDGKSIALSESLKRGPVLLVFFKVSCPVCQFALPFFERMYEAQRDQRVTMLGISQDDSTKTAAFNKQHGVSFPVLLDDTQTFPVSNAYGLTNVPTAFLIAQDGKIQISSVSWAKQEVEAIYKAIAEANALIPALLFRPDEKVTEFRAG